MAVPSNLILVHKKAPSCSFTYATGNLHQSPLLLQYCVEHISATLLWKYVHSPHGVNWSLSYHGFPSMQSKNCTTRLKSILALLPRLTGGGYPAFFCLPFALALMSVTPGVSGPKWWYWLGCSFLPSPYFSSFALVNFLILFCTSRTGKSP